jgi:hypothetical protein
LELLNQVYESGKIENKKKIMYVPETLINRFTDGLEHTGTSKRALFEKNYYPKFSFVEYIKQLEMVNIPFDEILSMGFSRFQKLRTLPFDLVLWEIVCIFSYTCPNTLHKIINEAIRSQKNIEKWKSYIFYLNNALTKIPSFNGYVYRGIDISLNEYEAGKIIIWSAFSSCTTNPNKAVEFLSSGSKKGTLFVILSKTSKPVKNFSRIPSEEETIF